MKPQVGDVVRYLHRVRHRGNGAVVPYYTVAVESVLMEEVRPGTFMAVPTVDWEESNPDEYKSIVGWEAHGLHLPFTEEGELAVELPQVERIVEVRRE